MIYNDFLGLIVKKYFLTKWTFLRKKVGRYLSPDFSFLKQGVKVRVFPTYVGLNRR